MPTEGDLQRGHRQMESIPISKLDTVSVILIGFLGAVISEGIAWALVYRKESFKKLRDEAEAMNKKIEEQKEGPRSSRRDGKIKLQEESLQKKQQALNFEKLKASVCSSVFYFACLPIVNAYFEGVVVAKLPFHPIWVFQRMTHSSLGGNDMTDCSMTCLYLLTIAFFRTNIQRWMGVVMPKSAGAGSAFGGLLGDVSASK